MKKFAFVLIGFALASVIFWHPAPRNNNVAELPVAGVAETISTTLKAPEPVWNRVNPPDVSVANIESAGPGGHIVLHLAGIRASENIDNVQVFFDLGAALPDGSVRYVRRHAASLVLESAPQAGTDQVFDVTEYFTMILSHSPSELRNFTVEFVQVPKNNGVQQNDQSFNVDWTYFEIYDAKGNPVPQEHREPKYG